LINSKTKFLIKSADYPVEAPSHVSYEDVGGLGRELKLIREMVELPLRYTEVFEKLGVEAPKGVLLYGPPGTGKTLIARAIASETKLHFIRVNGPEIIHKFYGESEARLREIFEDATRNAPSIIFIDEIDAIAPKRAEVLGDVEKRVVAQLLALMDGMVSRGQVIVIGATNIPEMIDPALRRPGRFDREMALPVPNVEGRLAILKIHSRRMPLAPDVDLERLSQITHAFVGADIEALCKEAGMVALRRYLSLEGENHLDAILLNPDHIEITMEDFLTALREIEPSATREFYTERSKVQWHHIGGLERIKETLLSIVDWPHKFPELFDEGNVRPPRGILFSGPSGTGKTLMAKALAGETGLNFISISGPILFSKWLGESEKALHQIFKKAKQSAPCILFFDEIDALVTTRGYGSEGGAVERMASQFFNELDNLSDLSQVIVLGATNREDLLDPALMRAGRLDYILKFPIPDEKERLEIFRVHTKERPLADDVNLAGLAKSTAGMAGSHIAFIARRATMLAIGELIQDPDRSKSKKLLVTASHFEEALKEVQEKEGFPHVEGS
jgi:transitional endoplasmic reticulum ATPase